MPKTAADAKASPSPTFETAIARLEQLVEEMDSANIPLQDLITRYEEGVKLVKVCEERLKEAEKRIEIITRNAAGTPKAVEFEADGKPDPVSKPDVSLF